MIPSGEPLPEGVVRLSVFINEETADCLRSLSNRDGLNVTEVIRRAVALLSYLDAAHRAGYEIQVKNGREIKRLALFVSNGGR